MHSEQSSVVRPSLASRGYAVAAGVGLLFAGYLFGTVARPAEANAAYDAGGWGGGSSFGFAVPDGGFGVVADSTGHAWVVDEMGRATRVIYSTSGSAPDQPGRTEDQLPLR